MSTTQSDSSQESGRKPGASFASSAWSHLVAVLWTILLAGVTLAPAFSRGWMIGPYDLLTNQGLTSQPGVVEHGSYVNLDPISQMIQWTALNWNQVHHATLPLWNPYNGLGLPLAFNWQSSSFGVSSLIGYLFPIRYAYTAGVVATMVIAGTGAYVLARLLRQGFLGALMVATVFELSGPLVAYLGYPQGQVLAFGGWLFAAGVLVVQGKRRIPAISFFAFILACSIYAGHPESLVVMFVAIMVFLTTLLAVRALPHRLGFEMGPLRRPVSDLVVATLAGLALGAPLLLPGIQLAAGSVHATSPGPPAFPTHDLLYLIFSSFDGVPVPGNYGFGPSFFYNTVAAYVGIIAVVLALIAIVTAIQRKRPEALAVTAVVIVMGAIVYVEPVTRLADSLPFIGEIVWLRALGPLTLALAVLAGAGLDAVIQSPTSRTIRLGLLGGFGSAALAIACIWLFGRNGGLPNIDSSLAAHVRAESFVWPAAGAAVGLAGTALLWCRLRLRFVVALALLACETLFLIAAGSIQIASSANGNSPTPAVSALQHDVGAATVGTDSPSCSLGIRPEVNIAYQVHELNLYDPIVPKAYYTMWQRETGQPAGSTAFDTYCPAISTSAEARLLGVGYVLVDAGSPGPPGSVFVTELKPQDPFPPGDILERPPSKQDLYRISGAGRATVIRVLPHQPLPPADAAGTPVHVTDSNPAHWSLRTDGSTALVLRLHLTEVPGWHATIDGRPLQLQSLSDIMFQARIPPGRHSIELRYWPTAFTAGLVVALVTVLALAVALLATLPRLGRNRSQKTEPTS